MAKNDGRKMDYMTLEQFGILAVKRVMDDWEALSAVMRSFGLCRTGIYIWNV
jgi:hypothetical protein